MSTLPPDFDEPAPVEAPMRDTRLVWAGLFLSMAVFSKVPAVDLWVSARYWRAGEGFFAAQAHWIQFSYLYTPSIGRGMLALAALFLVVSPWLIRWAQGRTGPREVDLQALIGTTWRRTAIALLLVGGISSGLLVEVAFKGHVGRPRPVQTVEFGGTEPFHTVFEMGTDPVHHKSFTSGHAAVGFSLMALGLCASPVWRRRWFFAGLFTGSVVGLGRIMQGGHYISDVVFSFYTVWLTCELVAYGFRRYDLSKLPPHHPDRIGPRRALR